MELGENVRIRALCSECRHSRTGLEKAEGTMDGNADPFSSHSLFLHTSAVLNLWIMTPLGLNDPFMTVAQGHSQRTHKSSKIIVMK